MPSQVDPLSWVIIIDEQKPHGEYVELWGKPSNYPAMRKALHESIHFWHTISTTQGIYLAFDCLKSMNALRFASRKGISLLNISKDWKFDGYIPFEGLQEFQKSTSTPYDSTLTISHLYEGLAKYWDEVICGGFVLDSEMSPLLQAHSSQYSLAYSYMYKMTGNVTFILFPIFAYLALTSDHPIEAFFDMMSRYNDDKFHIPKGNFHEAWDLAWTEVMQKQMMTSEACYGPMSSYKAAHRKYVKWKIHYAGLIPEDPAYTGHPLLEPWIQNMMVIAQEYWPDKSTYDLEVYFLPEFIFLGNPLYRLNLVKYFHPPLVVFEDGEWNAPPPSHMADPPHFRQSMLDFRAIMGAAIGIMNNARGHRPLRNKCPHSACPLHQFSLCSYVIEFPSNLAECRYPHLFKTEYGLQP
jgi:hypothetical protein